MLRINKPTNKRSRLDLLLLERGLVESRERAQGLILAGHVFVAGQRCDKPGTAVDRTVDLTITGPALRYVSRGGLKLEHALTTFGIDVQDLIAADVGASTGGFTDCLLQAGARRVYAIDVGRGILHAKLRYDPRVVLMEGINARYLTTLPEQPQIATFDLAFISIIKVIPAVIQALDPSADLVLLIKPQFEAGPRFVGKGGVVRLPQVRQQVVSNVLEELARSGLKLLGVTPSPIRGSAGNIEYLTYATLAPQCSGKGIAQLLAAVDWT
ncbi:MAG: TlyA family RNA methyltransferase [Chloroflexi bacterium]|nr:TlyA family RNA methyltransferase [Chloroflexota bacterium]